ncbi:helix-turn-helix domain-containing protein [bacterium]|nr:helix-turn-helix domain-containing protein [bacterium]
MKNILPIRYILLSFMLLAPAISTQSGFDIESEIQRLDSLDVHEYRLAVDTLHFRLARINDLALRKDYTERLFSITAARDEIAHIRSLVYPVIYSDSIQVQYLNEAFRIAKKYKSMKEMAWLEERRCRYYMEKAQYDSAMASILKLRDDYRPKRDSDDLLNIENLLGDIYYKSGLYEQARKVYLGILKEYERKDQWDFWRPYVIMNNIGLIGLRTRNYQKAINWFSESLRMADIHLTIPEKNNIRAFSLVKLMETTIQTGSYDQARQYLEQVESIPQHEIYLDVQQERMFWNSKLLLMEGDAPEALTLATALMAYGLGLPVKKYDAEIHLLMSQIHKAMGNSAASLQHLEKHTAINESLSIQSHLTRSLLILAEKDHQFTKDKLRSSHQELRYLAIIVVMMLLALLVVSVLYRRLYLSKLVLVNKAKVKKPSKTRFREGLASEGQRSEIEPLAEKLHELVAEKKIFLDPDLTLQKTAGYLSTNRTYLSNAVNHAFNMNFPTYINQLRVQESIRLISEGFTSKQTLEALAKQSGFANRTVFITAFKKHTGVTPSFFIKNF